MGLCLYICHFIGLYKFNLNMQTAINFEHYISHGNTDLVNKINLNLTKFHGRYADKLRLKYGKTTSMLGTSVYYSLFDSVMQTNKNGFTVLKLYKIKQR